MIILSLSELPKPNLMHYVNILWHEHINGNICLFVIFGSKPNRTARVAKEAKIINLVVGQHSSKNIKVGTNLVGWSVKWSY